MDSYLSVVARKETGLFHGAVYRSRPTPSGCERYCLSVTLNPGSSSIRGAAKAANEAFPGLRQIDVAAMADLDLSVFDRLPSGSRLTVITPRNPADVACADVEIVTPGSRLAVTAAKLTPGDISTLLALGRIVHDSSSGDDPALSCLYDHYLVASAWTAPRGH